MAYGTRPVPPQVQGEPQMADATVTLTKEQFDALLAARAPVQAQESGLTAEALAQAFKTANTRENAQAPMVSTYNPKGETKFPRPPLRCKTYQNGVVLDHDTLTWEEIEALNALPPGEFKVSKANGVRIPFTVKHTKALDGETLEKVELGYPCKDDMRYDHRGLFEYCVEALEFAGKTDEVERVTKLHREMEALRRKSVA